MNDIVTITAHQSYSWVLREVLLAAAKRMPYFGSSGFKFRRNPHPGPIQVDDLPMLGVYFRLPGQPEVMTPDGDGNAGYIRFEHNTPILFSVMVLNNDDALAEQQLDSALWALMNGLWRDEYLTSFIDTLNPHLGYGNPDNTRFESIPRGTATHHFGNAGQSNETPVAELRYAVTLKHRTEFAPYIPDDFLRMHVETVPLEPDGTIPGPDEVQRIITEYVFEPTSTTTAAAASKPLPDEGEKHG